MKRLACASCLLTLSLSGQFRENTTPELTCDSRWNSSTQHRACEVREQRLPVTQRLDIEAGPNGGVSVKGWNRQEILVRVRVEAVSKASEAEAKALMGQVALEASGGRVVARGPEKDKPKDAWWSASYEVFVPHKLDLSARTVNGGLNLNDVEGQLRFTTVNGGVTLARVAGDVQGRTTNGGVTVDLEGARWQGSGLDVTTTNGGVTMMVPSVYSADLRLATTNGGVQSDFGPMPRDERPGVRRKEYERILGNGGATVRVTTTNGGLRLKKK